MSYLPAFKVIMPSAILKSSSDIVVIIISLKASVTFYLNEKQDECCLYDLQDGVQG